MFFYLANSLQSYIFHFLSVKQHFINKSINSHIYWLSGQRASWNPKWNIVIDEQLENVLTQYPNNFLYATCFTVDGYRNRQTKIDWIKTRKGTVELDFRFYVQNVSPIVDICLPHAKTLKSLKCCSLLSLDTSLITVSDFEMRKTAFIDGLASLEQLENLDMFRTIDFLIKIKNKNSGQQQNTCILESLSKMSFASSLKSLRCILSIYNINSSEGSSSLQSLSSFSNLTSLNLDIPSQSDWSKAFLNVLYEMPQIRVIFLSTNLLYDYASELEERKANKQPLFLPNLQELTIEGSFSTQLGTIAHFGSNLYRLTLKDTSWMDYNSLTELNHFRCLKELALTNVDHNKHVSVHNWPRDYQHWSWLYTIETLQLDVLHFDYVFLHHISKICHHLKSLTLRFREIDKDKHNANIINVLLQCHTLTTLSIFLNDSIPCDEFINTFSKAFDNNNNNDNDTFLRNLTSLDVRANTPISLIFDLLTKEQILPKLKTIHLDPISRNLTLIPDIIKRILDRQNIVSLSLKIHSLDKELKKDIYKYIENSKPCELILC